VRVEHLTLDDFRNYTQAEVGFSAGPNLIIGRNGQGKTNLVEAIGYFSTLSSHRVSTDAALIRAGQPSAIARMRVAVGSRDVLLELQLNRDRPNRAQLNRNAVRPRELSRWFSSVLFAPEDLLLIRGEPGVRRRFLDEAIVARTPSVAAVLADYERVVRQRSALLKSLRGRHGGSANSALEVWDEQLIELGTRIILERRRFVEAMRHPLGLAYESIVQVDHRPQLDMVETLLSQRRDQVSRETFDTQDPQLVSRETVAASFAAVIERVRRQEVERGVTLIGPHRDDLLLTLHELPVKGYASHGESWSFALALKLALAELLREESASGDPVIILDDVFAELDTRRRAALMSEVGKFEQVIVTAAVEEDVPVGDWSTVRIDAGAVVSASSAGGGGTHA